MTGNIEDLRLHLQNQAVRYFDEDVYHRVFGNYASPLILDVGCGTGDMIVDMTDHNPACRIYGIDLVKRQIELAAERYPQCKFLTADIEQDSFQDDMRSWMESEDIQGFDIINCSMILMHLSDPVNAPEHSRYHEAYEWIAENIDEIKKYFSRDDFIFNIGFMSFSAMR